MNVWNNIRMFLWMTLVTGIAYPLLMIAIAQLTMQQHADGDLITVQEKTIGAALIAQKFEENHYFWPRPSFNDYNPLPSGGSNLGPTSAVLKKIVEDRKAAISKANDIADSLNKNIPQELLFASGSGLDPHISPATAHFQIRRIAKARGLNDETLSLLIDNLTEKRRFGFIGEPCVNVLKLNLTLDATL